MITADPSGNLERLASNADGWWSQIEKLSKVRLLGSFFEVPIKKTRLERATRPGVRDGVDRSACLQLPAGFQLKDRKKVVEVDESLILRPVLRGEKTFVCPLSKDAHPGLNLRIDLEIYDPACRLRIETAA